MPSISDQSEWFLGKNSHPFSTFWNGETCDGLLWDLLESWSQNARVLSTKKAHFQPYAGGTMCFWYIVIISYSLQLRKVRAETQEGKWDSCSGSVRKIWPQWSAIHAQDGRFLLSKWPSRGRFAVALVTTKSGANVNARAIYVAWPARMGERSRVIMGKILELTSC